MMAIRLVLKIDSIVNVRKDRKNRGLPEWMTLRIAEMHQAQGYRTIAKIYH